MGTKVEYKPLTIPKVAWNKKKLTVMFGELVAQPLEPGFGLTLGNALRRVLLGGVEGSAVTSVIIKGANNEFASIPGIVEDVMQLVLNIKGIVIRNTSGSAGTMRLRIKGDSVATAGNIEPDEHLEIVNKEHVLAHVSKDGELDIEFFVESGRGYRPAQWPIGQALQEDGRIFLDAMFSPVSRINFDVEKTRVGGDIDYDKLILNVFTNGAETPVDVVNYAVSVLRTQFEHFLTSTEIPFNKISHVPEEQKEEPVEEVQELGLNGVPVDLLLKPIDELELSVRAHNCLVSSGKKYVLDLVNLTEDEGMKIKNFGRKSLNEVKESLKGFSLTLGMNIKEADIKKLLKARSKTEEEE
jgi:DNA-directed RNA polymerase subunit alpha